MPNDFLDGCRYLCDLRPETYQMSELRYWTESQLAEELADVAQQEDPA